MNLTPHYSGKFESFRLGEDQYARLQLDGSYIWFLFDFFSESYAIINSEYFGTKSDLFFKLEKLYQELKPINESQKTNLNTN